MTVVCVQQEDILNRRYIFGGFAIFLLTIVYLLWKHAGIFSLVFGTTIAVIIAGYVLLYLTCFAKRR
jgi:branched-subunit amino acid transport protein AzlD